MIEELDTFDWEEAFKYADGFSRDDVETIVWLSEGENDERNWLVGGELANGSWFFLSAGCDYTGWGCQEWGESWVRRDQQGIVLDAMGDEDRRRLGVSFTDSISELRE